MYHIRVYMSDIEDQKEKLGGSAFDQKPGNSVGLMIFSVVVLIVTTTYVWSLKKLNKHNSLCLFIQEHNVFS